MIAIAAPSLEAIARPALPAGPTQVYFLAIGSQDYAYADPSYPKAFAPVFAPEHGAERVAAALLAAGAVHGILLTSDARGNPGGNRVSRSDVYAALFDLKARIRRDRAPNPRIVLYYMGHGLGDAATRFAFLVPGNLVFDRDADQTYLFRLLKRTNPDFDLISALMSFRSHPSMAYLDDFVPTQVMPDPTSMADVVASARRGMELSSRDEANRDAGLYPPEGNAPVPYVLLIDACYGGILQDLMKVEEVSPIATELMRKMSDEMKDVQSDGLVVYATTPGNSVGDYPDLATAESEEPRRIGPLAARLLRAMANRPTDSVMRFGTLRDRLMDPVGLKTDDGTIELPRPHSLGSTLPEILEAPLFGPPGSRVTGDLSIRKGTGTEIETCCRK